MIFNSNEPELESNFREAIRALRDRGESSELAIGSLLASVYGDVTYEYIAREELAPRSGELDLHLSGGEVVGHSANAAAFGDFVKKIADSVKIIARESMGRQRMESDLLVEAGAGSVRVLFRTPDPVPSGALGAEPESPLWSDPNRQAIALQQVASLLSVADADSADATAMDGLVESIPPKARPKLVAAISAITREGWDIEGEFRQRGLGLQPIRLSPLGARRLKVALEVKQRDRTNLSIIGVFDGHRRARSICWFIEDGTNREITAVVPTPELQVEVASKATGEDRVLADFTVITTHGPGSNDSGTKSFILQSIRPALGPLTLEGV